MNSFKGQTFYLNFKAGDTEMKSKKIHFADIAEPRMADLALALQRAGYSVTTSDEPPDPIKGDNVRNHGLDAIPMEALNGAIDVFVIGSGTTAKHPQLQKAQELKLNIKSLPDFIYQLSMNKQRLVVAGTRNRGLITSLVMHILTYYNRSFDFITDSPLNGFESTVRLTTAPLIIIDGQEIPRAPLDNSAALLKYHHHIGVISDMEWIPSDAYPSEDEYYNHFKQFETATPKGGVLIYFEEDKKVKALVGAERPDVLLVPFKAHATVWEGGQQYLITSRDEKIPIAIPGPDGAQVISASLEILKKIGVTPELFYQAIADFTSPSV